MLRGGLKSDERGNFEQKMRQKEKQNKRKANTLQNYIYKVILKVYLVDIYGIIDMVQQCSSHFLAY